jgi:hypothetical protein
MSASSSENDHRRGSGLQTAVLVTAGFGLLGGVLTPSPVKAAIPHDWYCTAKAIAVVNSGNSYWLPPGEYTDGFDEVVASSTCDFDKTAYVSHAESGDGWDSDASSRFHINAALSVANGNFIHAGSGTGEYFARGTNSGPYIMSVGGGAITKWVVAFIIDGETPFDLDTTYFSDEPTGNNQLVFGRTRPGYYDVFDEVIHQRITPDDGSTQSIQGVLQPGGYAFVIETNGGAGAVADYSTGEVTATKRPKWSYNLVLRQSPRPPELSDLSLKSSVVSGCKSVTGTVTLSSPAPAGGVAVTLGDNLASASVPAKVTVLQGTTAKGFAIKTLPVGVNETGAVSATLGGTTLSRDLTVRPMGLTSVTLSPATVVGSQPATGTATLECNAGPGAVTVDLASSNGAIAYPVAASVSVPQGLKSATFDVATNAVLAKTPATISGAANGVTKSKALTVNPAAVVSPTSLKFGNVTAGTTSALLNATLTNKGAVAFSVNNISLTGTYASWFAFTEDCPDNLPAGASCTIGVAFTPQAATSKSAKLTIVTGATSTPLSVSLSGTGI